jgi:hypothetical protein
MLRRATGTRSGSLRGDFYVALGYEGSATFYKKTFE